MNDEFMQCFLEFTFVLEKLELCYEICCLFLKCISGNMLSKSWISSLVYVYSLIKQRQRLFKMKQTLESINITWIQPVFVIIRFYIIQSG